MTTTRELFAKVRPLLLGVPSTKYDAICPRCLGPKGIDYAQCVGCLHLFARSGAQFVPGLQMVPVTTAENPSPWYRHLQTYKGMHPEYKRILVSVYWEWMAHFRAEIEGMLGGSPNGLVITPSKRGVPPTQQPLASAMRMVSALPPIVPALTHKPDAMLGRNAFDSSVFIADGAVVDGRRLLLVDDTWVSGATATSAAGALLNAGAASVLITPIVRLFDPRAAAILYGSDHPYRSLIAIPADSDFLPWPR